MQFEPETVQFEPEITLKTTTTSSQKQPEIASLPPDSFAGSWAFPLMALEVSHAALGSMKSEFSPVKSLFLDINYWHHA